ncbi:hypothetical protein BC834DRAFT_931437 [Gloeopeniophorella convolvens]|nr:hypothetical protein BC834DRAFT_931437 [Gloeopeniophorella convolvens]
MPSFLSKLLGRKKPQEPGSSANKRKSNGSLLEGKFEAVSPSVSPSAALFTDPSAAQVRGGDKAKDKEPAFNLLRAKSRPSESPEPERRVSDVPLLSLSLPATKERSPLDVVFESDPEAFARLNEAAVGEKRLTPNETLSLVRACSQAIVERGLETLGIMHPHWHSASPEVQHRLVSLYLLSLASKSPDTTVSPSSSTATAAFESELNYARSPYDIAAVLRWGLRHLKVDGASFGKESGDWTWFNTFAEAERAESYPPDAFSKALIPQLPEAHADLLVATLDIISSLAAHSEVNGISGSKLSKFFGLWLLTAEPSVEGDDWNTFYGRWDRAGRILEHLFLARIRDDAQKMPRRLTNLVEHYPYTRGADTPEDGLLPRPRFSTREYDALFVRLETEYTGASKPKPHPLRLIADALQAQSASDAASSEDGLFWDTIKKASVMSPAPDTSADAAPVEPIPVFANVFADETIRLLSLVPLEATEKEKPAPTFVLRSPVSPSRPRSFSLPESPISPGVSSEHPRASSSGHAPPLAANISTAPTTASPETPTDWLQFSNKGFGTTPGTRDIVATLWDNDIEKTVPPPVPISRRSSRRGHSRRSSIDSQSAATVPPPLPAPPAPPISKTTLIAKVKIDEAFIDFWADALLDPISKSWPRFVICQFKARSDAPASPSTPNAAPSWLVVEQRFVRPPPPPAPVPAPAAVPASPTREEAEPVARPRASSPRPSLRAETSRLSSAFSLSSKKRFNFFSSSERDPKSPKKDKAAKLPLVGEFGESVPKDAGEEVKVKEDAAEGTALAVAAVGVTAAAVTGVVAATSDDDAGAEVPAASPEEPTEEAPAATAEEPAAVPAATEPAPQNGAAHDAAPEAQQAAPAPAPGPETVAQVPADADGAVLPPAPEPLVLAGSTPGPELALATSEPVAVAQASADVVEPVQAEGTPEAEAEAEAEAAEPAPVPFFAGISEGPVLHVEPVSAAEAAPVTDEPAPATDAPLTRTLSELPTAVEEVIVNPVPGNARTPEPTVEEVIVVPPAPAASGPEPASVVEADAPIEAPVPVPAVPAELPAVPVLEEAADVAAAPAEVAAPEPEEAQAPTVEDHPAAAVSEPEPAPALVAEEAPLTVEEVPAAEEPTSASAANETAAPAEVAVEEAPAAELPVSVSEEEAPAAAVEEPVVEAAAAPEEVAQPAEEAVPAVPEEPVVPAQPTPEPAPVVEEEAIPEPPAEPTHEEPAPVVEQDTEPAPVVDEKEVEHIEIVAPAAEDVPAAVETVTAPVAEEQVAPAVEEQSAPEVAPLAAEPAPIVEVETPAPALEAEAPEPASEEPQPAVEEPAPAAPVEEEPASTPPVDDAPVAEPAPEVTPADEPAPAEHVAEVPEEVPDVAAAVAQEPEHAHGNGEVATGVPESGPVAAEPVFEEAAPKSEEAPVVQEPATEVHTPAAEEAAAIHVPVAEEPTAEESSAVVEEPAAPAVEEPIIPLAEEPAQAVEEPALAEALAQEPAPVVEDSIPEDAPALDEEPVIEEESVFGETTVPVAEKSSPSVEVHIPGTQEDATAAEPAGDTPIPEATPPAPEAPAEESAPAAEEPTPEAVPVVEEPVAAEEPTVAPSLEEPTPIPEAISFAADASTEEPTPAESTADEPAVAPEVAPVTAQTPAEEPVHEEVAAPASAEPVVVTEAEAETPVEAPDAEEARTSNGTAENHHAERDPESKAEAGPAKPEAKPEPEAVQAEA